MNDEQESESYRLIAWILAIAVTVAISAALIPGILLGINSTGSPATTTAPAPAPSATPAPAPSAAAPVAPASAPATAPAATSSPAPDAFTTVAGPAKIYFASGKVSVGDDSEAILKPIVDAIKSGSAVKAIVSGYHDKTGNQEQNAELAKNRAKSVRDELTKAGLADSQVELKKPQETEGNSDDREARRVEVTAVK